MDFQGLTQKFRFLIGIAVLCVFIASSGVSQQKHTASKQQIRARVVSTDGTLLTHTRIHARMAITRVSGSGSISWADRTSTDAEGYFSIDSLLGDPHLQLCIVGVEHSGLLGKTGPFLVHPKQSKVHILLTLNDTPILYPNRTRDEVFIALRKFCKTPPVWAVNPENGHAYKEIYCYDLADALAAAEAEDAYLVALNDSAEEEWIISSFQLGLFWIGLSDVDADGKWSWQSGEPVTYTNWGADVNIEMKHYAFVDFFVNGWMAVADFTNWPIPHRKIWSVILEKPDLPIASSSPTVPKTNTPINHPWEKLYEKDKYGHAYRVNPENGHAYKKIICGSPAEAKAKAEAQDAYLVTINDAAEQKWLSGIFGDGCFWIGLRYDENEEQWQWDNGEPVTYTNWGPKNRFSRSMLSGKPGLMTFLQGILHSVFRVEDGVVMTPWDGAWYAVRPSGIFFKEIEFAIFETDSVPIHVE